MLVKSYVRITFRAMFLRVIAVLMFLELHSSGHRLENNGTFTDVVGTNATETRTHYYCALCKVKAKLEYSMIFMTRSYEEVGNGFNWGRGGYTRSNFELVVRYNGLCISKSDLTEGVSWTANQDCASSDTAYDFNKNDRARHCAEAIFKEQQSSSGSRVYCIGEEIKQKDDCRMGDTKGGTTDGADECPSTLVAD
eukprot:TRINITY_DN57008_c0_g1_i1.p1 TRINITY_DN57008_c0_g1~~TRINITY_DN57008_c0_g1_i1.p1  ORF type:complete len:195 (+),score=13.86 TRINITY_DN57008_c0_g1_i1:53-637(+)